MWTKWLELWSLRDKFARYDSTLKPERQVCLLWLGVKPYSCLINIPSSFTCSTGSGPNFIKPVSTKSCSEKSLRSRNQPTCHIAYIVVTGAPLISCLANKFAEHHCLKKLFNDIDLRLYVPSDGQGNCGKVFFWKTIVLTCQFEFEATFCG